MIHDSRFMIHDTKGQIILEALVALSVLTFGLLGLMTLLSQSLGLTRQVSDTYTATYLAAEGIEIVKNLLDANIVQGKTENDWADGFKTQGFLPESYEVEYDDTSPGDFRKLQGGNRTPQFLRFDPATRIYGYDAGGKPTPFTRAVSIFFPAGSRGGPDDEMIVNSVVRWTSRGRTSSVALEDHFYNWRP